MNKEKFDYFWKITLLIVLVLAIGYMGYAIKGLNQEAMACRISPFVWGVAQAEKQGIYCYYKCLKDDVARISIQNITTIVP